MMAFPARSGTNSRSAQGVYRTPAMVLTVRHDGCFAGAAVLRDLFSRLKLAI